jgi:hypothetical protein
MPPLPVPAASPPTLFGETATSALLPWSWAVERLTTPRNYWIATVRPSGRPHCRPHWGVWLADGFWFCTGSQAAGNLAENRQLSVHLESGTDVLIVEGFAERVTVPDDLERFVSAYNAKYDHTARVSGTEIADAEGDIGPAYRVRPRVVYGWQAEMRDPTRWSFPGDAAPGDAAATADTEEAP